ncbi:MAG: AI-2E family transporter [Pirellulales bacterium]|nr:AI-2E family transporter [Pirellulales bacterium]
MARIISFVALMAIMLVIAAVFFQVMADFILPLFLALLLVIIFGPVHRWFQVKCQGHDRIAAGLTTLFILVLFLVPTFFLILQAVYEANSVYYLFAADVKRANVPEEQAALEKQSPAPEPNAVSRWFAKRVTEVGKQLFDVDLKPDDVEETFRKKVDEFLTPLVLRTGRFIIRSVVGLIVIIIAVYYFFADGPVMIRTLMRITPLEEKYEAELLERFVNVTRAVVLSQVLAALVQGLLAGLGFYVVGADAVFLLMVLTMLFAMIPFIGAASVWGAVAAWLVFIDQRIWPGVFLALYGLLVVSTIDNVIKPWVLHGRSKLHPLLALLSIIGGIKAMGPIGIFVGPMAVAFLQTLLNMINTELTAFSNNAPKG